MFSVLFATWGRLGYVRFGAPGRRGFFGGLDVPFEPVLSRLLGWFFAPSLKSIVKER